MKNLLLIFVASVLFISCNDEATNTVNQNDLAGTWNLTEFIIGTQRTTTAIPSGDVINSTTSKTVGKESSLTFTFDESTNEFTTDGEITLALTTDIGTNNPRTVEVKTKIIYGLNSGAWKIENDQLIFSVSEKDVVMDLDRSTDGKIVLKQTIDTSHNSLSGDKNIKTQGIVTIVLEK